jgi:hypothetical protein
MIDRREAANLSLVKPGESTPSPLSEVYSLPYLPNVTLNITLIYIHILECYLKHSTV